MKKKGDELHKNKAGSQDAANTDKQAEESQRESERKYKLITEKMTDIVWIAGMDLKVIYVTPSVHKVLGFTQEEVENQTLEEKLTPNSLANGMEKLARELAIEEKGDGDPNRTVSLVLEYYHRDGSTRWLETIISGIRNDQGVLTGLHGVARDITGRKMVEDALRASEEKFVKSFRYSPSAMCISSISDGRYVDVNNVYLTTLGYKREEIIGRTSSDINLWVDMADRDATMKELIQKGKVTDLKLRFRDKQGDIHWGLTSASLIRTAGETYLLTQTINITEQKRAEEKLRKSEELFTKLVNTIPDIIVHTDLEGNIMFANENTLPIFGYKREEIEGQNVLKFVVPRDQEVAKKNLKLLLNGRLTPTEFNLLAKDGREIPFEINGDVLRKEDGTPFGIVHVCRDITERKRTERVLRENDERLRGITQNLPGIIFQFYAKESGEYGMSYISEPLDEFSKIIVGDDAANLDTFFSSFVSRVYEEDRDRFLASIKTAVETVTPWNFEGRIALQSGMMVWFQGLSIPTRYEDQLVFNGILLNITEQKQAENELKLFAENLEDANIALRVLMNRRDKDQKEFEEKLQVNINDLVIPYLKKLKMGNLDDRNKNYVSVLENNLSDVLSPFMRDIRSSHKNLTPQEIQIVDLIRQGKNTKEIANMLNASANTIATHRDNIRKKMNLINSKINLRSHILSLK